MQEEAGRKAKWGWGKEGVGRERPTRAAKREEREIETMSHGHEAVPSTGEEQDKPRPTGQAGPQIMRAKGANTHKDHSEFQSSLLSYRNSYMKTQQKSALTRNTATKI